MSLTRDEARKVFLELRNYYPRAKILKDHEALEAYGAVLQRYDYDAVRAAITDHVLKSPYFPSVCALVGALVPEEDAPRSKNWMKKHAAAPCGESVSRYARTHDLTWEAAKKEMEEHKCFT